ncbi:MAG: hypothetical protein JSW52_09690 [Candidatus Coatesbacteria bacterium]|nr:MAG: hypothetical protein JSW52_09690 [Candidatus Coatesbacteria bacterium]
MTNNPVRTADAVRFKNRLRFWLIISAVGTFLLYPIILIVVYSYFGANIAAVVTVAWFFDIGVTVFMVSRFPDVEVSRRQLGVLRYLYFTYVRWDKVRSVGVVEGESNRCIVVTYSPDGGGTARLRIPMSGFSGTDRERLTELIFQYAPKGGADGS